MAIFKENLTSKILQKHSLMILNSFTDEKKVLEIGCGDGNITRYLLRNQKKNNKFFCSDISSESVEIFKNSISENSIKIKCGKFFDPWKNEKPFDLIISDVSSVSEPIALASPWYEGVVSNCGDDGLKNINIILKDIKKYLSLKGLFILPIISLCNLQKLDFQLKKIFTSVKYTDKVFWPMPDFFKNQISLFEKLIIKRNISLQYKFGSYYAFTSSAICSNNQK